MTTSRNMWQAEEDGRKALLNGEVDGGADDHEGMLQDYIVDFNRLRTVALDQLRALSSNPGGGDVRAAERAVGALDQYRKEVEKMRKGMTGAPRKVLDETIKDWTAAVAECRRMLESAREERSRRELLGNHAPSSSSSSYYRDSESDAARQQAFRSTETLEDGTRKLQDAVRQALETETVSAEVLSDLTSQREMITSVRSKMRTIGNELSQARQSLSRMLQRAQQNRLVTSVITLVLGLGLAIWLCCFFGLDLKYTILLAVCLLVLIVAVMAVRRRRSVRDSG
mmetsp:Transcript_30418/g.45881  ORF Transcript_30418/g.45881 Transcript_30418/m.45881 type:complete len:283 (+) Transcript_30418:123-971(+)